MNFKIPQQELSKLDSLKTPLDKCDTLGEGSKDDQNSINFSARDVVVDIISKAFCKIQR